MNKSTFESKVMEILRENSTSKWRRFRDYGRIDPASLHEHRTNTDIFRLREIPGKREYAIAFVLDASGSMREKGKNLAAIQMAVNFAESMNVLGIPFAVTAFGSESAVVHQAGSNYNRPDFVNKIKCLYEGNLCVARRNGQVFHYAAAYAKVDMSDPVHRGFKSVDALRGKDVDHPEHVQFNSVSGGSSALPAIMLAYSELSRFPGKKIVVTMSDGDVSTCLRDGVGPYSKIAHHVRWSRLLESKIETLCRTYDVARSRPKPKTVSPGADFVSSVKAAFPQVEPKTSPEGEPLFTYYDALNGFNAKMISEGAVPIYMDIKSSGFTSRARDVKRHYAKPDLVFPADNAFVVDDLAEGYDMMIEKLSENFKFDYDRKLR